MSTFCCMPIRVHGRLSVVHVCRWETSRRKWLRIRFVSRLRVFMLRRVFLGSLRHRAGMHVLAVKRICCRALASNLHHAVERSRRRQGQPIRHRFSMMRTSVSMTVRVSCGSVEGKRIGRGHGCGSFPVRGRSGGKENDARQRHL